MWNDHLGLIFYLLLVRVFTLQCIGPGHVYTLYIICALLLYLYINGPIFILTFVATNNCNLIRKHIFMYVLKKTHIKTFLMKNYMPPFWMLFKKVAAIKLSTNPIVQFIVLRWDWLNVGHVCSKSNHSSIKSINSVIYCNLVIFVSNDIILLQSLIIMDVHQNQFYNLQSVW